MADYLPRKDTELLGWSANMAALISAVPADWGLSLQQATDYQTLHDAFAAALAVTQGPNRGPTATQVKNTAKENLVRGPGGIRKLVGIVQNYPDTTDAMRVQLRITVPDVEPSPIGRPTMSPEIDLGPPVMRRVRVTLHNEATLGRRGKPDGVAGALIFTYVGVSPPSPADTGLWELAANITKPTTEIQFPSSVPKGSTVWISAYWYNPRGESGPSAPPVYTILPGTLAEAA